MEKKYIVYAAYITDKLTPEIIFHKIAETSDFICAWYTLIAIGIIPYGLPPKMSIVELIYNTKYTLLGRSLKGKPGYKFRFSIEN